MKKFSPEQTKQVLIGALLAVLGFNLSIHYFEKDEHGFAKVDAQIRQDLRQRNFEQQVADQRNSGGGVMNLSSELSEHQEDLANRRKELAAQKKALEAAIADATEDESPAETARLKSKLKKIEAIQKAVKAAQDAEEAKKAAIEAGVAVEDLPTVSSDKAKSAKTKSPDNHLVLDNGKTESVQYVKLRNENQTLAIITEIGGCECTTHRVLDVSFDKDLSKLEKALRLSLADKDKKDDDEDDDYAGLTKAEKAEKIAKAKKEKKRLKDKAEAEKKTAEKERIKEENEAKFTAITDDCAAESDKADETECKAKKMLELYKENKREDKEHKIADSNFKQFYLENVEQDVVALMINTEDGRVGTGKELGAGLKTVQKLLTGLPSGLESLRSRLVVQEAGIVRNMGAGYQAMVRQQEAYKKTHAMWALDPVYQRMVADSNRMKVNSGAVAMQMIKSTDLGLGGAVSLGNLSGTRADEYNTYYADQMTQVKNGVAFPLDQRYLLQTVSLGGGSGSSVFTDSLCASGMQLAGESCTGSTSLLEAGLAGRKQVFRLGDAVPVRAGVAASAATTTANGTATVLKPLGTNTLGTANTTTAAGIQRLGTGTTTTGTGGTTRQANGQGLFGQ